MTAPLAAARVRHLVERIAEEDNQFGTSTAGWVWWQDTCEELAEAALALAKLVAPAGRYLIRDASGDAIGAFANYRDALHHATRDEDVADIFDTEADDVLWYAEEGEEEDEPDTCRQCCTETEGLENIQGTLLCEACIAYNVSRCL